ncbi:MAG TPA: thioredoxin family protein [Candidatus Dormibacteraeota bacterium]|nr:thioredoxin family protein [Candidatus Dormibacteraeota bacterium]
MERGLVLVGVALLVGVLVVGGRLLARRRLRQVQAMPSTALWDALAEMPDGRPTVVAFSTPGCAACYTAQRPALTVLERRSEGRVRVLYVDAAERPETASAFGVMTVPATVVLGPEGSVVAANQGFATTEKLAEQVGLSAAPSPR